MEYRRCDLMTIMGEMLFLIRIMRHRYAAEESKHLRLERIYHEIKCPGSPEFSNQ